MGVGFKGKRNSAELGCHGEPRNSTVGKKDMAVGAGGGRRSKAGVVNRKGRGWSKSDGKVGKEGMEGIRSCRIGRGRSRRGDRSSVQDTSGGSRSGGVGDTLQRVVGMEDGRVIGGWTGCTVSKVELVGYFEMLSDKEVFVEAGEAIDVFHHPCGTMEDLEEISKKLLRPTTNLVDRADIFQNLLDGAAIAEPEEFGTPKELAILTDCPTAAASFTDKRMIMTFSLGATAGAKTNRAQTGAVHGKVEGYPRSEGGRGRLWRLQNCQVA